MSPVLVAFLLFAAIVAFVLYLIKQLSLLVAMRSLG